MTRDRNIGDARRVTKPASYERGQQVRNEQHDLDARAEARAPRIDERADVAPDSAAIAEDVRRVDADPKRSAQV